MGFAVMTNLFFAGILTLVFPSMVQSMTSAGALGLFAFFNLLALLLIFLLVPETAERSLEDLDYIFVRDFLQLRYLFFKAGVGRKESRLQCPRV